MRISPEIFPEFSREDINKAGNLLGNKIPVKSDNSDAIQAFKISYNWRDAHIYPMQIARRQLIGFARSAGAKAVTAARPKRMASIRRKLSDKHPSELKLSQVQDLAGCRAIVPSMESLDDLLCRYLEQELSMTVKHTDYLACPRGSGYRGHHIILRLGVDLVPDQFAQLKVEVQLRTQLQHAWATAVEAVGLLRNEDLKSGEGNPGWLRLFQLMGSEMAAREGTALVPGTPEEQGIRRSEIAALDEDLGALNALRIANDGFRLAEDYLSATDRPFYVLRYNRATNSVAIGSFQTAKAGLETEHQSGGENDEITSVLVAVDKVKNLKEAYPNYFMDVSVFANLLEESIGKSKTLPESKTTKTGIESVSWLSEYNQKRRRR